MLYESWALATAAAERARAMVEKRIAGGGWLGWSNFLLSALVCETPACGLALYITLELSEWLNLSCLDSCPT